MAVAVIWILGAIIGLQWIWLATLRDRQKWIRRSIEDLQHELRMHRTMLKRISDRTGAPLLNLEETFDELSRVLRRSKP